jgi:large-conductance mechanosensitive channel
MDAFFARFVTEGTLLNLVLVAVCVVFYRLNGAAQDKRDEDRKVEQAARKADSDAQAAALDKMADALQGIKPLVEMIHRQVEKDR